jgi:hypothetical protein
VPSWRSDSDRPRAAQGLRLLQGCGGAVAGRLALHAEVGRHLPHVPRLFLVEEPVVAAAVGAFRRGRRGEVDAGDGVAGPGAAEVVTGCLPVEEAKGILGEGVGDDVEDDHDALGGGAGPQAPSAERM